jgi:multisubunit Na+/H+ antiporter MnhB subunit
LLLVVVSPSLPPQQQFRSVILLLTGRQGRQKHFTNPFSSLKFFLVAIAGSILVLVLISTPAVGVSALGTSAVSTQGRRNWCDSDQNRSDQIISSVTHSPIRAFLLLWVAGVFFVAHAANSFYSSIGEREIEYDTHTHTGREKRERHLGDKFFSGPTTIYEETKRSFLPIWFLLVCAPSC